MISVGSQKCNQVLDRSKLCVVRCVRSECLTKIEDRSKPILAYNTSANCELRADTDKTLKSFKVTHDYRDYRHYKWNALFISTMHAKCIGLTSRPFDSTLSLIWRQDAGRVYPPVIILRTTAM